MEYMFIFTDSIALKSGKFHDKELKHLTCAHIISMQMLQI